MSLPKFSLPKFSLPKFSLPKFSPSLQPLSSAPVVPRLSLALVALASLATLLTTGCSTSFEPTPIAPVTPITTPSSSSTIEGKVHGGNQPISGAAVYVYAASTTGYGGAGIAASTANASTSLLKTLSGVVGVGTTKDSNGNYYVTTRSDGSFSLGGSYVCTVGQQVYLYVVGGNTGAGGVNTASGLLAALGQCPSGGSLATTVPYVWVNEVTTIATAYALAGFATDATHIGSSGSALAATGIANAFLNVTNLVNIATGTAYTTTPVANGGNGTVPQAEINSLANTLAACVNTASSTSSTCNSLLTTALAAGASGAQPTDTATAAINIAHYPGNAVSTLFGLPSGIGAPFQPALPASPTPNDFSIGLAFTGGGLGYTYGVAVDASDNVWAINYGSSNLVELSHLGAAVSPSGGYTGGAVGSAVALAIDTAGNVWVSLSEGSTSNLSEFSNAGAPKSGTTGYSGGGMFSVDALAIDSSNNIWMADASGSTSSLSEFNSGGSAVTTSVGYTGGGINNPSGVAIDHSGYVWATNKGANFLSKFSSGGTPVSSTGYSGGGLSSAAGLAIDASGNIWTCNGNQSLSEFSNTGSAISSSSGFTGGGLGGTCRIAIDGAGNPWITGTLNNSLSAFTSSGLAISPSTGYQANLSYPSGLAIDGSGNVWVATGNAVGITEIVGIAAPVVTPISIASKNGTLGTRP